MRESDIIEKIVSGNEELYRILIDKYSDVVYSLIYGICRDREETEELAQDVFVKAFFSLKKFRGDSSFRTWIYRIAYNLAISKKRKRGLQTISIDQNRLDIASNEENRERKIEDERRIISLQNAIDKLEKKERFIILSFYRDELSVKDLASITGLSEANIKVKLYRIRKKILENGEWN